MHCLRNPRITPRERLLGVGLYGNLLEQVAGFASSVGRTSYGRYAALEEYRRLCIEVSPPLLRLCFTYEDIILLR